MDLIKVKDSRYSEYEKLLLRRDSIKKKAEQYGISFMKEFGDLLVEAFRLKIESIKRKKQIAYCQKCLNQGKTINQNELDNYIESVMFDYYSELQDMINDNQAVKESGTVSGFNLRKIKEIYYYLAKKIHPDKRPDLAKDENIRSLWFQIVIAYNHNQLDELQELKFKVEQYLESIGEKGIDVEIPDVEEKIEKVLKQIDEIISKNPYQYKFILEDENEVKEYREELEDEIQSFKDYCAELDEVLNGFNIVRLSA